MSFHLDFRPRLVLLSRSHPVSHPAPPLQSDQLWNWPGGANRHCLSNAPHTQPHHTHTSKPPQAVSRVFCFLFVRGRIFYEKRAERYTAKNYVGYPRTDYLVLLDWEKVALKNDNADADVAAIVQLFNRAIVPHIAASDSALDVVPRSP